MIVFAGNANKTKVKNAFVYNFYQYTGSIMYNKLNNGSGWVANNDAGMKTDYTDMNGYHYRLYAAGGSYMTNISWGNYVLATTHCDFLMGGGYGWSEICEDDLCYYATVKGWTVYPDLIWFYNYDNGRQDGSQYWLSNGYASKINIP